MPRAVLDMMDRRPIWAMPEWVPFAIRDALPSGWELIVIDEHTDGSGDGAARVSPRVLDAVSEAEVYFGYGVPAELLDSGPRLRWVHSGAAGVGGSLTPTMLESPVIFTNSAGIHAPPMAETVLGMLLHFCRGLDLAVQGQSRGEWSSAEYYVAGAPLSELSESTVGIVGFGGIGREIARRVASLGARVIAVRRGAPAEADAELTSVLGGEKLGARIEILTGDAGLDRVYRESDALIVAAPDTPETRGMIDGKALGRMKPGAVLINVARGRLVDEAALIEALSEGRLRGAGLDVFSHEPLPAGHPLWTLPNVMLTPHVSAVTRRFWGRETSLILRNLTRHLSAAPLVEWENVVDKRAGY
ncbi:MAG: D-2-hydroxyacid dehydrogenase [Gemmatimonadetes bacterium]|nr:D-2-hydroxyacid dehydrogenase [Gemmatimonadota bacterium]MDA1102830.1 D-2-hydroxyacid dehydrogenase [Gemmatimonadota bacterium]